MAPDDNKELTLPKSNWNDATKDLLEAIRTRQTIEDLQRDRADIDGRLAEEIAKLETLPDPADALPKIQAFVDKLKKDCLPEVLAQFLTTPIPEFVNDDNGGGAADNGGADGGAGADAGNGGSGDGATDDTAYPLLDANIKTMQDMQDFLGKLAVILLEREDKVAGASLDEIFNNITTEYKVDKISALPEFMVGKIVPLFSADLKASDANFTKTRTLML